MTTISLAVTATGLGPTASLVAGTQFFPVIVGVVFDYATSGQATVQTQNVRNGEWVPSDEAGGALSSNAVFYIRAPSPGLRLNVTSLTAGQIALSVRGSDDGSIHIPTFLTSDDGTLTLTQDDTVFPLIKD